MSKGYRIYIDMDADSEQEALDGLTHILINDLREREDGLKDLDYVKIIPIK